MTKFPAIRTRHGWRWVNPLTIATLDTANDERWTVITFIDGKQVEVREPINDVALALGVVLGGRVGE